ncbi:MAG: UvrD-helicase domain-containing protein [bacterium]|nr:UvrD-helicase domain-containing protein [bacterium]
MDYKSYILGCIEQYQDFQTATKWFERAKLELSESKFIELPQDIQGYFLQRHQFTNAKGLLHLEVIPVAVRESLQKTYDTEIHLHKETLAISELNELLQKYQFEEAKIYFTKHRDVISPERYEDLLRSTRERRTREIKDEIVSLLGKYEFEEAELYYNTFANIFPLDDFKSLLELYKDQRKQDKRDWIEENLSSFLFDEVDQEFTKISKWFPELEYKSIRKKYWNIWEAAQMKRFKREQNEKLEKERLEKEARLEQEKKEIIAAVIAPAVTLLGNGNFREADSSIRTYIEKYKEIPELLSKYEEVKSQYIKRFLSEKFRNAKELSDEQLLAIADIHQNLLLRARAGSGKTTTLASKIAYLIHGEMIDPNNIVALCFNAAAAKNIIEKLKDDFAIEYKEKQNIATFHSLAGQISQVEKDVETLFDDRDPLSEQKLTGFVEKILEKKWDKPFLDLEKEDISNTSDSIFGFIKKILVKFKYATYKNVVYAIAREDKRFDTDEEADELENHAIQFGSKEHYLYRRNLTYTTLDGKHVKSFGEKCIADYLFEHDIKYTYEPNERMDGHTYYPDFKLYEKNIIIEHWGIDEFDKQKRVPKNWLKTWDDYVGEMEQKRKYWKTKKDKNGKALTLLETNITQLRNGREGFENEICATLKKGRINNARLSIDEIITKMSHNLRSEFSKKIVSYIQKAKQNKDTPEKMKVKINEAGYSKYSKVNVFLNLANEIYKQYETDKKEEYKVDFFDFLLNAEKEIDDNYGNCKLRSRVSIKEVEWLLIDEFQDFSPLFLALVKAIQKYNPKIKLFCVGDDWQAINSFAGSDVELFSKFQEEFPVNSAIKNLTINQRSNANIVDFGNRIMTGHGVESKASPRNHEHATIEHRDVNDGWIENNEVREAFSIDINAKFDIVLLRYLDQTAKIIDKYIKDLKEKNNPKDPFKLLILSRKSKIKQYSLGEFTRKLEIFFVKKYPENKIKAIFNERIDEKGNQYRQIEAKTAHQAKGLEANVVIVLEATSRCFPLIHPDSLLFEIFGDSVDKIVDEERRLFYVACTRAKSDLYILYEEDFDRKKTLTEFYPF